MKGQDDRVTASGGATRVPAARALRRKPRRSPVRRLLRLGAIALFLVVVAFAAGFGWFANHIGTLAPPADPRVADGIIVLTGGQFRLDAAVDLLKSGKGRRLLISGVNPVTGARDLQVVTGADARLFQCCIDIDRAALDTAGNAEEGAKWARRNHFDSLILVTNNYHIPRTMLEMRLLLSEAELQPYPVVNTRLDEIDWLRNPDAVRVLLTEYAKYVAALARTAVGASPGQARLASIHAAR